MNLLVRPNIYLCLIVLFIWGSKITSAQVGVNTTTPDAGAAVDITSSDKGLLIPRLDILDLKNIAPVTGSSTESLLVYNTNTTTGKGFYFWDGSEWIKLNSNDWKMSGNAGTNPGVDSNEDFIGTNDNTDLFIARNSIERISVLTDDIVFNNEQRDINFSIATDDAGDTFFVDGGENNIGIGTATPDSNTKLDVNNSNTANLSGYKSAVQAETNRGTTSSPGYAVGVRSIARADNEDGFGISAGYYGNTSYSAGGEFFSASSGGLTRGYSLVAAFVGGTTYKIIGNGTVSTLVKDENDQQRVMYAPEAPEVVLQDYGVGKLVNGEAQIIIDPILAKNILVDGNHPLKVFVTLEGDCNGIYVTNKSQNGFTVKELQHGKSNISFSWQIIATRANETDNSGRTVSNYADQRFPIFERNNNMNERSKGQLQMEKKRQTLNRE